MNNVINNNEMKMCNQNKNNDNRNKSVMKCKSINKWKYNE